MSETVEPIVNNLNAPFWAAAREGRLCLPHCETTRRAFWPPSPYSPFVTGGGVAWIDVSAPTGRALSVVVYHRPFQKAFASAAPYGVALVELDAGPRLMVHVPAPNAAEAPRAGDSIILHFAPAVAGGPAVPQAKKTTKGENA
jgi:uncharacterized OB-fold protein